MTAQHNLVLVLIAALSLAAVYLLVKLFARRRVPRTDGFVVSTRPIGTSWHVSLRARDLPSGLHVGRPPNPPPHDLVPLRAGLAAWGLSARRRFGDTPLKAAWLAAEGEWTLGDGALESWVRAARPTEARREIERRVSEGLALGRRLRNADHP